MNKDEFIQNIKETLNITLNDTQLSLFDTYLSFLQEYNSHTNLTAITDTPSIYLKHFYDSSLLLKYINIDNKSIIDIGTGAGFPGLVLKILNPSIHLTLLDSNNKKTSFLNELIAKLNLNDIKVVNARAEEYVKDKLNSFDIVTSRAVAFMDIISSLSLPYIKLGGKVVLMKGNLDNELQILEKHSKELNISNYNIIKYKLPNNDERNLVLIEKNKLSNIPNYNKILKQNKLWTK